MAKHCAYLMITDERCCFSLAMAQRTPLAVCNGDSRTSSIVGCITPCNPPSSRKYPQSARNIYPSLSVDGNQSPRTSWLRHYLHLSSASSGYRVLQLLQGRFSLQ